MSVDPRWWSNVEHTARSVDQPDEEVGNVEGRSDVRRGQSSAKGCALIATADI
jgi:hypothetical protein